MPPRTRRSALDAPQAGDTGALGLASLPDELLVRCIEPLSKEERFNSVALVNKRFAALCLRPRLLRTINASIGGQLRDVLPRSTALCEFLAAHARHVRCLELDIWCCASTDEAAEQQRQQVAAVVTTALGVCAAGSLEQLSISEDTDLACLTWLPALVSLRQLRLGSWREDQLEVPRGISKLSALTDAELAGRPLSLGPDGNACLPASLTRLHLVDSKSEQMPHQLSRLSALHILELIQTRYAPNSMALLTSLASLRRLELQSCSRAPSCLSALTQLEALKVFTFSTPFGEGILAALPHLSLLTSLDILSPLNAFPASIAALGCLQHLCVRGSVANGVVDFSLPRGAWLSHLRRLDLPWGFLEAGAASGVLAGAARLEHLNCLGLPAQGTGPLEAQRWAAFWRFAATHPPLRNLTVESFGRHPSWELLDTILVLQRRRPDLLVQHSRYS